MEDKTQSFSCNEFYILMNPETTTENHNSKIQPMVGRAFKKYSFIMILIVLSWHFFFFEVWQIVLNLFEMDLGPL